MAARLAEPENLYDKELWIGLAEVEQTSRNGGLGDVRGAFTNAVAMANGKANFRAAVKRVLDDLGLRLIHLKEAETLKTRNRPRCNKARRQRMDRQSS